MLQDKFMKPSQTPRKKRFRTTIRSIFVLVLVTSVLLAWVMHNYRRADAEARFLSHLQAATKEVNQSRLEVYYDYQFDHAGAFLTGAQPRGPRWIGRWLGEHLWDRVHSLEIHSFSVNDFTAGESGLCNLPDDCLDGISELKELRHLTVVAKNLPVGHVELSRLQNLEGIRVYCADTFDLSLVTELRNLNELTICGDISVGRQSPKFQLDELTILGKGVRDLKPFGDLGKLSRLCLGTSAIGTDEFPVKHYGCELTSLESVSPLFSLKEFHCAGTELVDIGSLAEARNLTTVVLSRCPELQNIDGIARHAGLKQLGISFCGSLDNSMNWGRNVQLPALEKLSLNRCPFSTLVFIGDCKKLKQIHLIDIPITNLDSLKGLERADSIKLEHLENLETFQLPDAKSDGCKRLEILDCYNLKEVLLDGAFMGLEELVLQRTHSLEKVSGNWPHLKSATMNSSRLRYVHLIPPKNQLAKLSIGGVPENVNLKNFGQADQLKELVLFESNLDSLELFASSSESLEQLRLIRNHKLRDYSLLGELEQLKSLELKSMNWKNIKALSGCRCLTRLKINNFKNLDRLEGLGTSKELEELEIHFCGISNLDDLEHLQNLKKVSLKSNSRLANIDGLFNSTGLKSLHIGNCRSIKEIKRLGDLSKIEDLDIYNCGGNIDALDGKP